MENHATQVPTETEEMAPEAFQANFVFIKPAVLEEWPEVDAKALYATGGDLERVVDLLARTTDHRALVQRRLEEIAARESAGENGLLGRVNRSVRRLELRTQDLFHNAGYQAEEAVVRHLWRNLFLTLAVGLVVGMITARRRG